MVTVVIDVDNDSADVALLGGNPLVCFTDGSLLKKHTSSKSGFGAWITESNTRLSESTGQLSTIFQAEVRAILEVADVLLTRGTSNRNIYIFSDSQAALKALDAVCVRSSLIDECYGVLNRLGEANTVVLQWVRGHAGTAGNDLADELAKAGAAKNFMGPEPAVGISPQLVKTEIHKIAQQKHVSLWRQLLSCQQAKEFGIEPDIKRAKALLRLPRPRIRAAVSLLTGHGGFNKHLFRMGLCGTSTCPSCRQEEDTACHLLCRCEALHYQRLWTLGQSYLEPADVGTVSLDCLLSFLEDSGRWSDITGE